MQKQSFLPHALMALGVVGGGMAWLQCGGSSTCGNGKVESGEQCDKGPDNGVDGSGCSSTCSYANIAVASIQVSYSKLLNEVPGFNGVACADLGIGGAHVVLSGPQASDEQWMGCTQSKMFTNVPPGTYQASITLLGAQGNALTNTVTTAMTDVQKGPVTNLNINFHQADFVKQDYTGDLDWNPSWGGSGKKCGDAGVTTQQLLLRDSKGKPVMKPAMTKDGSAVNGGFSACFSKDASTLYQRIGPLAWGHYTLTIVGKGGGNAYFCKPFEVFVAPGASWTYELMVDSFDLDGDGGTCP